MTDLPYAVDTTEPVGQEVVDCIDKSLCRLQKARLDTRNEAALVDIFKGRNPYFLRSTRKVAYQLVSYCLDNYLLSADEILFANFARELSALLARRGQHLLESSEILEIFAKDDLPLEIELLNAYSRASNRLLYRFYEELCDEDARIDWVSLAEFMSNG